MTSYLLRAIPADLWSQVKALSASQGHSLRYVLIVLLRAYIELGRLPEVAGEPNRRQSQEPS